MLNTSENGTGGPENEPSTDGGLVRPATITYNFLSYILIAKTSDLKKHGFVAQW